MASLPAACRSSRACALAARLGHAEEQVLGRDVLVAEATRLCLGPVDDRLAARVERQRAALDPGAPGQRRGDLAAEGWQVDAEPAQRLGRDAVVGLDERAQQVFGVEDRAVQAGGRGLGLDDGLLGLLGEAIELHGSVHPCCVGRVGRRGRGSARPPSRALSLRSVGQDDPGPGVQVAAPVGLEAGHPLAGQPEGPTGLRAGRDRQQHVALGGAHLDVGAEQCLAQGQRQLPLEIGAAPREDPVGSCRTTT